MKNTLKDHENIDIQQLKNVEEYLIRMNYISSSKEFAELIGEKNDNGLSDIKYGRKKLKIENLRSLKFSHPEININCFFDPNEPMVVRHADEDELDRMVKENAENKILINNLNRYVSSLIKELDELKSAKS